MREIKEIALSIGFYRTAFSIDTVLQIPSRKTRLVTSRTIKSIFKRWISCHEKFSRCKKNRTWKFNSISKIILYISYLTQIRKVVSIQWIIFLSAAFLNSPNDDVICLCSRGINNFDEESLTINLLLFFFHDSSQ